MKTCKVCGVEKPFERFYYRPEMGRYRNDCKDCNAAAARRRYKEVIADPVLSKEDKRKSREYKLRYRYTITREQYENLYNEQEGHCKICKAFFGDKLCVDHCHGTGNIRGLLCSKCNSGIGYLKDNITVLESAIDYLRAASI
jgi:hypothetical protein